MRSLATRLQHTEARLAKRKAEPVLVYVDPVFFARHKLGFQPDSWQAGVLQSQSKKMLLNVSRQAGKSSVSAILALHQALYFPHSLVLLVSPSLRQSAELFRKVQDFLSVLPVRPALLEDNKLSLRLKNASRIVSLPSKEETIRGFSSVSLLIEDESSRVSDDLYRATRPMLSVSNGRHLLLSTPWGKRGHFYECWESGGSTWERIHITAYDCPRISPEFLAEEQENMPEAWFQSEYLGVFTDSEMNVFRHADIQAALDNDLKPLWPVEDDFRAMMRRREQEGLTA